MTVQDWSIYPNFSEKEFACSKTGYCFMHHEMVDVLQSIRSKHGMPMIISSGYRHISHPAESSKENPGEHTYGLAADILCHGVTALKYIKLAQSLGVKRIGVHQKGDIKSRFIHLGLGDKIGAFPSGIWTY